MLRGCGMHPDHQEALKKNRVVLAKELLLSELLEHLLEKDIITLEMREHIQVLREKRKAKEIHGWSEQEQSMAQHGSMSCFPKAAKVHFCPQAFDRADRIHE